MRNICIYLMLQIGATSFGQVNLVQNGDFEQYDACVTTVGQLYNCTGWHIYRATPDYFNTCADSASLVSIPYNGFGYQYPIYGNGYCGFYAYGNTAGLQTNYREVLGSQLSSTLIIGTKYYVTFYVNNSYGSYFSTRTACNKIGVLFSTASFDPVNTPAPINNFAHVYTDSIINDTSTWKKIKGSFIADSAYLYISIGNFFDAAHTDTMMFSPGSLGAYYYVDNVCISTDSTYCETLTAIQSNNGGSNFVNIYPNPSYGEFIIYTGRKTLKSITIYNSLGQRISYFKSRNDASTVYLHQNGIYLVSITDGKSTVLKKIIINNP